MSSNVVRVHVVVRGRVQMVGFRAFVVHHAGAAGLSGTVANAADGTVVCDLEGPPGAVDQVVAALHRGPLHARVDRVDVDQREPSGDLPRIRVTA